MKQRNKTGSSPASKSGRSRPRGRTVYIGERPKMPLIIAGVFVAGLLAMILATLFSRPRSSAPPAPASVVTNASGTNVPSGATGPAGSSGDSPAPAE